MSRRGQETSDTMFDRSCAYSVRTGPAQYARTVPASATASSTLVDHDARVGQTAHESVGQRGSRGDAHLRYVTAERGNPMPLPTSYSSGPSVRAVLSDASDDVREGANAAGRWVEDNLVFWREPERRGTPNGTLHKEGYADQVTMNKWAAEARAGPHQRKVDVLGSNGRYLRERFSDDGGDLLLRNMQSTGLSGAGSSSSRNTGHGLFGDMVNTGMNSDREAFNGDLALRNMESTGLAGAGGRERFNGDLALRNMESTGLAGAGGRERFNGDLALRNMQSTGMAGAGGRERFGGDLALRNMQSTGLAGAGGREAFSGDLSLRNMRSTGLSGAGGM